MYAAKVLADSVSTAGCRLTTFQLTYPRFVHAELMTHRVFSRNAASSRAIPILRVIWAVLRSPAAPVWWGKNQKGMQAKEELGAVRTGLAKAVWFAASFAAVTFAYILLKLGAHKQIVNRLLEPWQWITVIVSATEYDNWFDLRDHEGAQPEIALLAAMMRFAYSESTPTLLPNGAWHIPLIDAAESMSYSPEDALRISVARCARVSTLRHEDRRMLCDEVAMADKLRRDRHLSPFEHQAQAMGDRAWRGNVQGWRQYRKLIPGESGQLSVAA